MKRRLVVAVCLCLVVAMLSGGFVSAGGEPLPSAGGPVTVRVYYPDAVTGNQVLLAFEPWLL
jgi:hypothetical protein